MRISEGGTVLDPKLVVELLATRRRTDPSTCSRHENARCSSSWPKGQSNVGIAKTLWITHDAVEKHIKHIFAKLRIPATSDTHRRASPPQSHFSKTVNLRFNPAPSQKSGRRLTSIFRDLRSVA
jgi:DNA-binding NarL/FixJ family response regulator